MVKYEIGWYVRFECLVGRLNGFRQVRGRQRFRRYNGAQSNCVCWTRVVVIIRTAVIDVTDRINFLAQK
jgi:hypothetical protein